MRSLLLASYYFVLLVLAATVPARAEPPMRFENGLWFDGQGFQARTFSVADGRLSSANDPKARVIDLRGGYVVPPFCEAHNHNLAVAGGTAKNREIADVYLADGIFYVQIPGGGTRTYVRALRGVFNRPDTIDVTFTAAPLTGTGGHPIPLRETLLEAGWYPGFTKETLKDEGYFIVDSEADLDRVMPHLTSDKPDFVKAILVASEEHAKRRDDPQFNGRKGLDPALAPIIVRRSHDLGLRAIFHVTTAHDFGVALRAGADQIAHLPGYATVEKITDEDAALAARLKTPIHTTAVLIRRRQATDPERYALLRQAQIENLQLLRRAGANLVVGSDRHESTSVAEIEHLQGLGVFANGELLRMWTEACAGAVFPQRKVGRLADGYEASFLVLKGDPLADFAHTRSIALAVKDGRVLKLPPRKDIPLPAR
jgi:imidazolonepropionase-like amidohydrolase